MRPDYLAVALGAARSAAGLALERQRGLQVVLERSGHDIKLAIDRECETAATDFIRAQFPRSAVLGEEFGAADEDAELRWVVDPIDGTANYFRGLPYWCASVAVQRRGATIAAAVVAPALGEEFTATVEATSLVDVAPLPGPMDVESRSASVHLALGSSAIAAKVVEAAVGRFEKIRIMGSIALDLCNIASGRADGLLALSAHEWDYVAGLLIAEGAGATSLVEGDERGDLLLCGSPKVVKELRAVMSAARR